jgi:hypothetical protein
MATDSVSLCGADEKLTANLELESAIRALAGGVTCYCAQNGKG